MPGYLRALMEGACFGPPRPQTPRQGTTSPAPRLGDGGGCKKQTCVRLFLGRLQVSSRATENEKADRKNERARFSIGPLVFPVRFAHRPRGFAALPGNDGASMPLEITRYMGVHRSAFSGSLFGFEERTPRSVPSCPRASHFFPAAVSAWQPCSFRILTGNGVRGDDA